jgi:hypothetical protein
MSSRRLFASVDRRGITKASSNFAGLPPDLTEGEDQRRPLPHPDVLVIEAEPEGVFLFRYTAAGEFGGDTWHESIADAKAQAEFEYGDAVGGWFEIPTDERDAESYALRAVRDA